MIAISYVELTVTDLAAAQLFYSTVFGWQFNAYGPSYAGIRAADGAGEVGGLAVGKTGEPRSGEPLLLIEVDDLEATGSDIMAAGGSVDGATVTYPGGSRFLFRDPAGNRLGVFRSDHA